MWQSLLQVCRQIYHAAYIFSQGQATRRASLTWLWCPQLSDPVCVHPWLGYIPSLGATPQVPFMGKAKERHSLWHVWKMSTSRPLRIWALTSIWTTRLLQCFVNMYATFMISQLRKMLTRPGTRHSVCHHQPLLHRFVQVLQLFQHKGDRGEGRRLSWYWQWGIECLL